MNAEEKQALIKGCTQRVDALNKYCLANPDDREAALDLSLCKIALADLTVQPVISDDTKRMDWLVSKTVNVREPLRYGSRHLFWSEAVTDEEDDHHATLLREQIDTAIANEVNE